MLLNVNPGLIFWTVVTFLFLLLVLKKLAWKPILGGLESREQWIKDTLDDAEKRRREAEQKLAQYEQMLDQAKKETQEIINNSRKTAEMMKNEIVRQANEEAMRLIEKARRDISLESEKAIEEIRKLAVDLSVEAASKLIGQTLTGSGHREIVKKYIQEMKLS
ncbi:ATP synthase subunit b, sodium ion specific [bacterium BMS3Abin05]|nr:ATP synthase subunit b, sodium ion specific [bacterium BMS3Abin05]GBE26320.1 ATP synthase subunit b, sodium ion specific [bacterium BMS3Bbin03]HDK35375.1 ATP synthase F0 subunit B [Bacteroidota bacterium]HDZ11867.1 ATP synthase F0 subunit B [Bacteroidota bacterium]